MEEIKNNLKVIVLLCILSALNFKSAFPLFTNNGLTITIKPGLTLTLKGDFTNQTKNASPGRIDNYGTIKITGHWTNNSNNEVFTTNSGLVEFNGTMNCQNISGDFNTGFYDLTLNNTCPDGAFKYNSNINFTVKNKLSLFSGIMELNNNIITHGTGSSNTGELSHTAGWFKGGTIKRWVGSSTIPERDSKGHFPLGDSINYRPAWISSPVSSITNGGTISMSHLPANEIVPAYIIDDAPIIKKHKAQWKILPENIVGGNFNLYLLGKGLTGIENINELRICKDTSVCGLPGTNLGSISEPETNRLAINLQQLSGAFFIGFINGGPLPVKWLDFDAININKCVQLSWSTASENNNDYFTIEKSIDGKTIEQIASIPGAGNSSNILSYNYYDYFPYKGVSYYRIKQTDYDGKTDTTAWKMINYDANKSNFTFNLFPNPLIDGNNIKLDFEGESEEALVTINDLLGNMYFSKNYLFKHGENNIYLDSDKKLQAGIYNLTISNKNVLCRKKLIVK